MRNIYSLNTASKDGFDGKDADSAVWIGWNRTLWDPDLGLLVSYSV